ncbi:hypothetical protein AC578_478 [Pseudocercospora eumusae]|uniref:ABM domain-containing protein n=1 Tax=Pseudocercospora eumusae TaxID=321146 RepID=A0A139HY62_9PEZI|nr:hypothetical protein AC578_478 [Pseudocercospora eumusae]KXT07420.1 hypothetical protein AC578_478 [Pseudocercospora eumusae]
MPDMSSNGIALLCKLYPKSAQKSERVLELLRRGAREYYRKPEALCSTWCYFTPLQSNGNHDLVIAGLEVYDRKSALQAQVDDPEYFQAYHRTVKTEDLYAKDEELVAWYQTSGFLARDQHATPFGGCLVFLTKLVCKDRDDVLRLFDDFIPFVRAQEPEILTYALFTRPKAPNEVLLFGRCKDEKAAHAHGVTLQHTALVEKLVKLVVNDLATSTSMWREVDDSFVSNQAGGPQVLKDSRL